MCYHTYRPRDKPNATTNIKEEPPMTTTIFNTTMKLQAAHSALLQKLGFSKWFIRDYSPLHSLLVKVNFNLARKISK